MNQIHKIYHRRHRTIYVTYEPKWEKFQPPFWWCFHWAYKLVYLSTEYDKNYTGKVKIKQVQKGGNGSNQIQIGIVNKYNREDK